MRKPGGCFILILIFAMAQSLWATDYYVDASNGNDSNNGLSSSNAWRTVGRVNNAMGMFQPGDNILFRRGRTWTDADLLITRSGSAGGGDITFGAYGTGNKPDFNGIDITSSMAPGSSYITVENFNIRNTPGTSIAFALRAIIRNCDVVGSNSGDDCFTLHRDGSANDIGPNHYLYNCTATGAGEQGFDFSSANYIIMRNCTSYSQNSTIGSISFNHAYRVYIENHFCYNENDESIVWAHDPGTQYLIVTKSKFYNLGGRAFYFSDAGYDDIYILNNTIVDTGQCYRIHNDNDNVTVKNNIINSNSGWFFFRGTSTPNSTNTQADHNIYYDGSGASSAHFYDSVRGTMTLAQWQSNYNLDRNSSFVNPRLNNPSNHDFTLQSSSPAINAGGWITTIASSTGSGNQFRVTDANPFHDGFGVTTGSDIQLQGQSSSVRVTNINYSTNTITVNQNLSWAQGDGVAFAYSGYAPDNGAYEYEQGGPSPPSASASASPTSGTAPLSVSFTGSTSGGTAPYSYSWNFDDGGSSTAQNPSHAYTSAGTYTAILTVTDDESNQDSDTIVISVANPIYPLTASASASPTSGTAPLSVNFTGSASGGTSPYSYSWNFGDGGSSTAQNPSHEYSNAGTFIAILTVTDSSSSQTTDSLTINVSSSAGTQQLSLSSITGGPAPGFGGTTNPTPGSHDYASGSFVALSAIPNTDYRFSEWEGDVNASNVYNPQFSLNLDTDKDLSAFFCTRCGDVNGDLTVTASDAQGAFDIFLGRNSSPTKCETENADVSCDSNVTPGDAQAIFNKFLNKGELPADCSGNTRTQQAQSLSIQAAQLPEIYLIVEDAEVNSNGYIYVPIIIDNPSNIDAFGFDLQFPTEVMEFMTFDVTGLLDEYNQVDAYYTEEGLLRVGGYSGTPLLSDSPEVLITLVFRVKDEAAGPFSLVITNTYDDIKNATVKDGTITVQHDRNPINRSERGRILKRFSRVPSMLFIRI